MTIVANTHPYVIGVDTHAATHTYAVLAGATGAVEDVATFPATRAGMDRALAWIGRRSGGDLDALVVIEGIGSYGAQLARTVAKAGYQVAEPAAIPKALRRSMGKSDELDAQLIARSVLPIATDRLRRPRLGQGDREAMRILLGARDQLNTERSQALGALTALVRTHDLGIDARRALSAGQIKQIAAWRPRQGQDIATATARREATRLARRITDCDKDLANNKSELTDLVAASDSAHITNELGVGAVNAATLLTVWSHPGRIHSEAAFAAIAGTSPLPASSGKTTRHRLNRGGDRRLNRALHTILLTRMRTDPRTRAYVERRTAQGRTLKEIRRSLKRYLARQLYRILNNPPATATAA